MTSLRSRLLRSSGTRFLLVVACAAGPLREALGGDAKAVTVANLTGSAAAELHVTFGSGASVVVVPHTVLSSAGCATPSVPSNAAPTTDVVIDWVSPCVPAGSSVTFVAATASAGSLSFSSGFWADGSGASLGAVASATVTAMLGGVDSLTLPVTTTVDPPTAAPLGPAVIGTITAMAEPGLCGGTPPLFPGFASHIRGRFELAPGFGWLDGAYDFKWVQVITAYLDLSAPGGSVVVPSFAPANFPAFPAIDPAPCPSPTTCVPSTPPIYKADELPYYWNEATWGLGASTITGFHDECVHSTLCDFPTLATGTTSQIAIFSTFLVVDDLTGSSIGPTEFCVLDGFSWYYNDATGMSGLLGAISSNPDLVDEALSVGLSPFPSWDAEASSACPLSTTATGVGCSAYGPAPTIWADCSPKLGEPFTWHVGGLLDVCPLPTFCTASGGPVIHLLSTAMLPTPIDLATVGLPAPPGSCFLYLPAATPFVTPGPTGLGIFSWSATIPVPADPSLVLATVAIQNFQLAFTPAAPLALVGILATPALSVTIFP